MQHLSNLPPGVTDDMLPGNRPEDEEIEAYIIFTVGDVISMQEYVEEKKRNEAAHTDYIYPVLLNILEQLEEDGLLPEEY